PQQRPPEPMPSWGLRVTVPAALGAIHSCVSAPSLRRSVGPGGSRRLCPVSFSDSRRGPRDPRPLPGAVRMPCVRNIRLTFLVAEPSDSGRVLPVVHRYLSDLH